MIISYSKLGVTKGFGTWLIEGLVGPLFSIVVRSAELIRSKIGVQER
jgi:hypothetical protein